jgi:hypothetical protein
LFGVVGRACRHLIVRHSKVKKIVFKKQPKKSIKISLLQKRFTEVPFRPFRAICKPQKTKKQKNKTTSIRPKMSYFTGIHDSLSVSRKIIELPIKNLKILPAFA